LIPSTFHLHASDAAECDRGIISPVSGNRHGFSLQMRETRLSRIELWPPFSPLNISSSSRRCISPAPSSTYRRTVLSLLIKFFGRSINHRILRRDKSMSSDFPASI
jgi:hypothetical protein